MTTKNAAFDTYIAEAEPFARPILKRIRVLFHRACPAIEETIKWGFPHFEHLGIVGSMAAFKRHVSFGFWKGRLLDDPHELFRGVGKTEMVALKVGDVDELPADRILIGYIQQAVELNVMGVKLPTAASRPGGARRLRIPTDLAAALKKNSRARTTFDALSPSHHNEYVEWITEAKQESTRARRLVTAIEWLAQGRSRNWKYEKGPSAATGTRRRQA